MLEFGSPDICETCGSPFHQSRDCEEKTLPRYKTRKKMGLKPGELPFKFQVDINPEVDNSVEVARKRALLRLNTTKVYSQMGCAVKAHEASVEVSKWVMRMLEHCELEEKVQMKALIEGLGLVQGRLQQLRESKIAQSVKMEELLTQASRQANKVRVVVGKKKANKVKKAAEFSILRAQGNLPMVPDGVTEALSEFGEIQMGRSDKRALSKREYPGDE